MTSDNNSVTSEDLKNIHSELSNVISADVVTANSRLIFILATTLIVIYLGLISSVGVPLNVEEGLANAEFIDLPIDDDIPNSGDAQETAEQPDMDKSNESERESESYSDEN
ncbi:hypothetical protein AK88_03631 [Plasmodium fragile]|uniref:Uncharacterized protein n=1 Tax=Plasmodium fragile TaxID=5857 RepID=A0A0D9QI65_PLAFR|nr:uncharacterized protein AK88_03631 [Plasmodium fragile]KJP86719.1 hypothetical protein AK88_03631 [Plasmodium fragile]